MSPKPKRGDRAGTPLLPRRSLRFPTSLTRGPAQCRSLGAGGDPRYKFPPPTPSFSCESNRALGLVCKTNCLGLRQSRVALPPSDAQGKPSHSSSHPHSRVCNRHPGLPLS